MATKLLAAKMVTGMGEELVVADGRTPGVLVRVLQGERLGTLSLPRGDKLAARKRWIAYALRRRGSLWLDAGARAAVVRGEKSLLPSGIARVEGHFQIGDCVSRLDATGREIARGLVHYDAEAVEKIRGRKSREIETRLGYKTTDEVIHRDDLVVLAEGMDEKRSGAGARHQEVTNP